jgi:hypothetical protein
MAAKLLGSLLVSLGLESSQFSTGLKKSQAQLTGFQKSMAGVSSAALNMGKALAIGAGLAAVAGFAAVAKTAFELGSSLTEAAAKVGVTVESLQEMRYVAEQNGVAIETMDGSLNKMTKTLGELQLGNKKAAETFSQLGLSAQQMIGLTPTESFEKIAGALSNVEDETIRAALGNKIFGRSYAELKPLVDLGADGIRKAAEEKRRDGVLSTEQAKKLDDLADGWQRLKDKVGVATAAFIANSTSSGDASAGLDMMGDSVGRLISDLGRLGAWIGEITTKFHEFQLLLATRVRDSAMTSWIPGASDDAQQKINVLNDTIRKRRGLAPGFNNRPRKLPTPKKGAVEPAKNFNPAPAIGGSSAKPRDGGGVRSPRAARSGPSAAEIERRFNDELAGYAQQAISAMKSLAMNAEERAELELRSIELARVRTIEDIKSEEDYSASQKQRLILQVEALADLERQAVEREKQIELEREADDMAQVAFDSQRDLLNNQLQMADTQADRKRIAIEILKLEQQYRRQQLELVLASQLSTDAEKARAQAILASLSAIEAGEASAANRSNETDAEAFGRSLSQTPEQINEALDGIKIDGLNALNQGLTDAIMGFRSLGDVAKNILQEITAQLLKMAITQMIIKPLANAMGFPIPGFAKGTSFAPGGMAIVGERGPELVNLPRGSQVIPNNELGGMGGRSQTFNMSFPNVRNAADARETSLQMSNQLKRVLNNR